MAAPGPFVSLGRLASATETALARVGEVVRLPPADAEGGKATAARLEELRSRASLVFDMTGSALTGPLAPELPVVTWALGSLPRGGGFLATRRRALKSSDTILLSSTADAALYERILGGSGPHGALLPMGVDLDVFRPPDPAERQAARRDLGLADGEVACLYAGRVNHQKNLHATLRLLAEARRAEPRLRLLVAGAEDDTPLREFGVSNRGCQASLERLAGELGVAGAVGWLGALGRDDLVRLLWAGDLFVSLSLHQDENFGYAVAEATGTGLPALVSDWGGYRDLVRHGRDGYRVATLVTTNGVRAAWRRGLAPLLDLVRDPGLRRRLGASARAHAVAWCGLERFCARLGEEVRAAAARRGPGAVFGDRAFRFHPTVQRYHARNALRHLEAERSGREIDTTWHGDEGDLYRFFVGPYATADVSAEEARPEDRPIWLLPFRVAPWGIASDDPIWPGRHDRDAATSAALAAADGRRTLTELADAAGLDREALRQAATGLARSGALDLGRDYPLA